MDRFRRHRAARKEGAVKRCHACGTAWEGAPGAQPGRNETCASCGADLHACLNCRLYDPPAPRECRSPTVERVRDKDRRNFCDEFEFRKDRGEGRTGGDSKGDMGKKWDDFFK
jgi:hypothetical protein